MGALSTQRSDTTADAEVWRWSAFAMRPTFEPIYCHVASPAAALAALGCRRKVVVLPHAPGYMA